MVIKAIMCTLPMMDGKIKGFTKWYATYTNADAQLLVGVNVMVEFV